MQSVSSRIWTRVAVFISYDNKNYTRAVFLFSSMEATQIDKQQFVFRSNYLILRIRTPSMDAN